MLMTLEIFAIELTLPESPEVVILHRNFSLRMLGELQANLSSDIKFLKTNKIITENV